MSLRKVAGLLAAFGLTLGLIGGGVGAVFTDQVTGTENINVGTFNCQVVWVTPGGSFDADSATYNAPQINSSAPSSAPFAFDVKNVGSIPMALSVSGPSWTGTIDGSFTGIAATLSAATLAPGEIATVSTGIQWTALDNDDLGDTGSATWTVSCGEPPVTTTVTSSNLNYSNTGWGGWSCPTTTPNIWSASYTGPGVLNVTLWQPGASVPGVYVPPPNYGNTYPATPSGYLYGVGEEGAIAQATGTGGTYQLILECY